MKCPGPERCTSHPLCRFLRDPTAENRLAAQIWTRVQIILLEREIAELEQEYPDLPRPRRIDESAGEYRKRIDSPY